MREHFSKIGEEIYETEEAFLNSVEQNVETAWDMDEFTTADEVSKGIKGMRESAPGPDLITVSLYKNGVQVLRNKVVEFVRRMWATPPDQRESICHEAEVIALFKKGSPQSLDSYRGICLLQIISMLIVRIWAKRLAAHVEFHKITATEQWGFRTYRSVGDGIFVMS